MDNLQTLFSSKLPLPFIFSCGRILSVQTPFTGNQTWTKNYFLSSALAPFYRCITSHKLSLKWDHLKEKCWMCTRCCLCSFTDLCYLRGCRKRTVKNTSYLTIWILSRSLWDFTYTEYVGEFYIGNVLEWKCLYPNFLWWIASNGGTEGSNIYQTLPWTQ